jgi:hypothetical protein
MTFDDEMEHYRRRATTRLSRRGRHGRRKADRVEDGIWWDVALWAVLVAFSAVLLTACKAGHI